MFTVYKYSGDLNTCPDFEWSKAGRMSDGSGFEYPFKNPTKNVGYLNENGRHLVFPIQNPYINKFGTQMCSEFDR